MDIIISLLLTIVGIINFLPVVGMFSSKKLSSAYNIALENSDLIILMKHRALLFGLIGGFILYSVFHPLYQMEAMIMAAISMIGFIVIAKKENNYNASLSKIIRIDVIGIICLVIALVLTLLNTRIH